jgi:hypothetical protein
MRAGWDDLPHNAKMDKMKFSLLWYEMAFEISYKKHSLEMVNSPFKGRNLPTKSTS